MNLFEIIISSFALASDAFSVSVSCGISFKNNFIKCAFIYSIFFGIFQGIMPLFGYIFGYHFEDKIIYIDHFVAFGLLCYIGIKMICDSFCKKENNNYEYSIKNALLLAVATSIDAASFGIAYACAYQNTYPYLCFLIICIITFILSFIGFILGKVIGNKFNGISNIFGGIILIFLAFKILFEHLFI